MNTVQQNKFLIDEETKRFLEAEKVKLKLVAQPLRNMFAVLVDTANGKLDNCEIPDDLLASVELLIKILKSSINKELILNQITAIRPVSDNQLQILISL